MLSHHRRRGFTLIELLIVISIVAILMSMILATVIWARRQASRGIAETTVRQIDAALNLFVNEEGYYPGKEIKDPDVNAFPILFEKLMGGKKEYLEGIKEADIAVRDEDADVADSYRQATADERYDPDVQKYILDPFGRPYWYRENKSKPRDAYKQKNPKKADIWSVGPDGKNQLLLEEEEGDDIGNW